MLWTISSEKAHCCGSLYTISEALWSSWVHRYWVKNCFSQAIKELIFKKQTWNNNDNYLAFIHLNNFPQHLIPKWNSYRTNAVCLKKKKKKKNCFKLLFLSDCLERKLLGQSRKKNNSNRHRLWHAKHALQICPKYVKAGRSPSWVHIGGIIEASLFLSGP